MNERQFMRADASKRTGRLPPNPVNPEVWSLRRSACTAWNRLSAVHLETGMIDDLPGYGSCILAGGLSAQSNHDIVREFRLFMPTQPR